MHLRILSALLLLATALAAQPADSVTAPCLPRWEPGHPAVMDDRQLCLPVEGGYRFLVAGHLYGAHANEDSHFPASSFLANLPDLDSLKPHFMVSLGDAVREPGYWQHLCFGIARQRPFPMLHVMGNHDSQDTTVGINANKGAPRQGYLLLQGDLLLFLDTEPLAQHGLAGGAIALVRKAGEALHGRSPRRVLVFSHRPFWAWTDPSLRPIDAMSNEPLAEQVDAAQAQALMEAVRKVSSGAPTAWFAGDMGAEWSTSLVAERRGKDWFVATGIGDRFGDKVMVVDVDSSGITIHPHALIPELNNGILEFDIAQVKRKMEIDAQNKALNAPRWAWLKSKRLWAALGAGLLLGFLIGWLALRRR